MAMSVKEVLKGMDWSVGGMQSFKDLVKYWSDDKAWQSDELLIDDVIADVRMLIRNFEILVEFAEKMERHATAEVPTAWQDRVRMEKDDLCIKIEKLSRFLESSAGKALSETVTALMSIQLWSMRSYRDALLARLSQDALEASLRENEPLVP